MVLKIIKPPGGGEVEAIASKSQTQRLLICAALADAETYIKCHGTSDDIDATVRCLESLGARICYDGGGFAVEPIGLPVQKGGALKLDCGESGATLRFMLPICCALGVSTEFVMRGRLSDRPLSPLLNELRANGCKIVKSKNSVATSGKLESGAFNLPGDVTSQFISGLLLALPLLDGDSLIIIEGKEESRPYISMTLNVLSTFGVFIERGATRAERGAIYRVKGPKAYRSPGAVTAEGDWSNAAFWLCAGAIGDSSVTCTGLNLGSSQGDLAIERILERFGADITYEGNGLTVTPARLRATRIDAGNIPDIVPVLSLVAAVAEGETVITNAGRLRMKESDRLHTVTEALSALGANITETPDGLMIRGKSALHGGTVSSFGDHRIAMMAAIASIVCKDPVTISGANVVGKSYPGFFEDFTALGGEIQTL